MAEEENALRGIHRREFDRFSQDNIVFTLTSGMEIKA
jgi:hypothetical protein